MIMDKGKTATGAKGEDTAVEFLLKRGLKILERNFRCPLGEVDIIAREGEKIVFVEVKTRRSSRFGEPKESVDEKKQRRLSLLALYFLKEKGWEASPARFDVIGIKVNAGGKPEIDWVRDAFDFHL